MIVGRMPFFVIFLTFFKEKKFSISVCPDGRRTGVLPSFRYIFYSSLRISQVRIAEDVAEMIKTKKAKEALSRNASFIFQIKTLFKF